jgi:nucleotide-binding universal stress UspA family protein
MQYKDMLVHMDDSVTCAARLDVAVDLAERFGAHLTGVYVDPGLAIPALVDVPISPELLQGIEDAHQERCDIAEKLFKERLARADIASEWRLAHGDLVTCLGGHARYSDLVILGQEGGEDQKMVIGGLPDSIVLTCGRPTLVVPYIGVRDTLGKHVMVAWNGSREAVRAVNDALPLLALAEKVEVLSINPAEGEERDADLPGADMSLHLARHGVTAEAQQLVASDVDVGDLLLSRAADHGADLIVMGAYGHARWREIVLGGATKQLLSEMTVPVLMSH